MTLESLEHLEKESIFLSTGSQKILCCISLKTEKKAVHIHNQRYSCTMWSVYKIIKGQLFTYDPSSHSGPQMWNELE